MVNVFSAVRWVYGRRYTVGSCVVQRRARRTRYGLESAITLRAHNDLENGVHVITRTISELLPLVVAPLIDTGNYSEVAY